jgi:transposase
VPEGRADKPAGRGQKGEPRVAIGSRPAANDARWSEEDRKTVQWTVFPTREQGKTYYGTRNLVNVDHRHKPIRRYHVSDAALHVSRAVDHLLMRGYTGAGVRADPACRSEATEATCAPEG